MTALTTWLLGESCPGCGTGLTLLDDGTGPARYSWELVEPGDQDHMPIGQRLLHVVADRMHWLQALDQARRRAQGLPITNLSTNGRAA